MIIDSHQHFVRLARHPEVEGFREGQLSGKNPSAPPEISDADVTKSIETVVSLMDQRNIDIAFASPRAKAMATHDGSVEQNAAWADLNNSLVLRACKLNPGRFAPVGMLGQHRSCPGDRVAKQMARWAGEGFVAFNIDPDGTGGRWTNQPFTGKHNYPIFEAAQALDVPLVVHGSESINPNFPHTAVQYLVADITGFVQLMMARELFKDFPRVRFLIPHGGGALPCQIGRWRAIAKYNNWSSPDEILGSGNVFVDSCIYNDLNMRMLFEAVPLDNILFGSECDGAFPGVINPESGDHADNTRRYVENSPLSEAARKQVFSENARRVYPKAARWL
ncbi:MAG TPA: amidohydrolase family protein [Bryobacteraceae bacterium]|jgi:4-oxalmesaconate hydratase|nr:amidohydrolase family protein [Bryobacteraceae bacterium]